MRTSQSKTFLRGQFPEKILREFELQAKSPPGGDKFIGFCYQATINLIKKNNGLSEILTQASVKRDIPEKHLVNLFFRVIQYIELYKSSGDGYPERLGDLPKWERELSMILATKKNVFEKLLLSKDTATTIYQRYAGPRVVMAIATPFEEISVADFGCGGNYGLRGISLGEKFEPVVDHTPGQLINHYLGREINFKSGLAIDKENLESNGEFKNWVRACSYYPSELNNMTNVESFEKRISISPDVSFLLGDIRNLLKGRGQNRIFKNRFDYVIVSTVLYQMPLDGDRVILEAKKILKPSGFVIVQDFAKRKTNDTKSLSFIDDWFKSPYTYHTLVCGKKTNWKLLDVFKWYNGRCREVKAGSNFRKFLKLVEQGPKGGEKR